MGTLTLPHEANSDPAMLYSRASAILLASNNTNVITEQRELLHGVIYFEGLGHVLFDSQSDSPQTVFPHDIYVLA